MGFFSNLIFGDHLIERKADDPAPINTNTQTATPAAPSVIEGRLRAAVETNFTLSAVQACARVIAEGLALPPCAVQQTSAKGKIAATKHPLYYLLNSSPNSLQTSYEFREQLGYHLALNGNAFVFINRLGNGSVGELLPCDPGSVAIYHDTSKLGAPVQYSLYGNPVPSANIWHLKGPSWLSWEGMSTLKKARMAISLGQATEMYGAALFTNGARPGGVLSPGAGVHLSEEQAAGISAQWSAQAGGVSNAHKTILLTAPVTFTSLGSTANEAQWIESRRFQLEEICRFFRVSPTKVMQQLGSQSYASVEQAHIAHDQDTDAHWHERFVQSANKALLTDKERAQGFAVSIDNRAALRGTAVERMTYYQVGIASGVFTRNEVREMEGFDRSDDPAADSLTPAANLFGPSKPADDSSK